MNFKIGDVIYSSIGKLNINGVEFVVVSNDKDIKLIEVRKIDNNIQYIIPNVNTTNHNELKGILFANELIDNLKSEMNVGTISTKEQLQEKIQKISNILATDDKLKEMISQQEIEEFRKNIKGLYEYFDSIQQEDPNLNLEGITSFTIEQDGNEKEYIKKYNNETGEVDVLVNRKDKNFVDQFKDKQNELLSAKTDDGFINADNTFDIMKDYEKEEVDLQSMNDINNQTKEAKAINSYNPQEANIIADPNSGIYVDTNTGDTLTTKVEDNHITVQKVGEDVAQSKTITSQTFNEDNNADETNYETPTGVEENLTEDELELLLVKGKNENSLTPEQIRHFEALLEQKRQQNQKEKTNSLEKDKVKVLEYKPDSRAAYISLISLCLFVQVFMLLIIIGTIFFMK